MPIYSQALNPALYEKKETKIKYRPHFLPKEEGPKLCRDADKTVVIF